MKRKMTSAQETAFRYPCFYAEETAHPRFGRLLELEGFQLRVRLTSNIGEE